MIDQTIIQITFNTEKFMNYSMEKEKNRII